MGFTKMLARRRSDIRTDHLCIFLSQSKRLSKKMNTTAMVFEFSEDLLRQVGWRAGQRVNVLFGGDEDKGYIMLRLASGADLSGSYKLSPQQRKKNLTAKDLQGTFARCSTAITVSISQARQFFPEHIIRIRPDYVLGEDEILINTQEPRRVVGNGVSG